MILGNATFACQLIASSCGLLFCFDVCPCTSFIVIKYTPNVIASDVCITQIHGNVRVILICGINSY